MPSTSVVSGSGRSSPASSASDTVATAWSEAGFLVELTDAVDQYDLARVSELCDRLVAHLHQVPRPYPEADARRILRLLRRKRCFRIMSSVAEALMAAGQRSPGVRCDYAQALIDQGMPAAALDMLDQAIHDAGSDRELAEAQGLRGRAYKQMYCATGSPDLLVEAIGVYTSAYQRDPVVCTWHGINAAALVHRAVADGIGTGAFPAPEVVASAILAGIESRWMDPDQPSSPWDAAIAMEACLALGRWEQALAWLRRYVEDARTDAFELASTHRQLLEVWRLGPRTAPGNTILPVLRAAILTREEGARLELGGDDLTGHPEPGEEFEKVLGHSGMVTHSWYRQGLQRSLAVARVEHESGRPVGTGFLVDWSALTGGPSAPVLVTNSHVLDPHPATDDTLPPDRAVAALTGGDGGEVRRSRVTGVLWTSPPRELDATVATLEDASAGSDPCPLTAVRPRLDGKQRVYVIGHPEGRELSYSIDDNVLLDYDDRVLHYRAPTEHGSSGSPVFNRDWEVVAVHHAGRSEMPRLHGEGTYPANEGIWIEAIRQAIASAGESRAGD